MGCSVNGVKLANC